MRHPTERIEVCRTNLESLLLGESNVLNVADVEWLIAEHDRMTAKLEMDCGSCHPCMNWDATATRRALRALLDAADEYFTDLPGAGFERRYNDARSAALILLELKAAP